MQLVLIAVGLFAVIGLSSQRFGWRQNALVAVVAVGLAALQFLFPRYL